jgi:hypothetical protein
MSTVVNFTLLYVGVCVLMIMMLGAYFHATGKVSDPVLEQWMRYVGRITPLILSSLPGFPPPLIPLVVQAINAAELSFGDGEGSIKKTTVLDVVGTAVRASEKTQEFGVVDMTRLGKSIDHIVEMANHASKISQNLDAGLNADGTPKAT